MTVSFRPLFERVVAEHVDIVLIGGFAAVALGVPYITQDVDLCYNPEPANRGAPLPRAAHKQTDPRIRGPVILFSG